MCKLSLAKNVRVIIGMVMCFAMTACSQGNQISYPTNNDFSTVYSQMDMQYSIYRYTYETNIQEDGIMLNRIG